MRALKRRNAALLTLHAPSRSRSRLCHYFALAETLTFRNLFIMRQLLFVFAWMAAVSVAQAADAPPLRTNSVTVGTHGTLEVPTPTDWTFVRTNLNLPGNPYSVEFHSPSNTIA